ncbi:general stress protein [Ureibacillus chungkukjangi]|uniref:general stress protein n=1 Tax=Ureibacillus chungkukjangi TaxID=1202712 RepID=UPI00384D60F1
MNPIDNGTPGRANIAVTFEKQEAMAIIERLKADGIPKGDIHVVGKELYEFANLKWDAEINLHRIGNPGDKIKSFFTGEDSEIEGLKHSKLPEDKLQQFKEIIDKGGVLIYTDEYLHTTKIVKEMERDPNVIDDPTTYDDGTGYENRT